MKERRPLTLALVLLALAFTATWWLTDGPLRSEPVGNARVAAVALRDHVIPFQKFGTKLFTVPTLGAYYTDLTYLTQDFRGDQHDGLIAAIETAAATHDAVDLWILAHGNHFVYWLDELSPEARAKLRLVYNTGCANAYQAEQWHRLGAKTYVGHPGRTSVSPIFYVFFARRWVRGWTVAEAVADANAQTNRRLRLFGFLTLGIFDGDSLARQTDGVATGDLAARIQ